MATNYPHAKFTSIDISPIQPSRIKPENYTFIQANIFDGLPFEDDTFDFVFQHHWICSALKDKWPYVIRELTRVLKPDGYLEVKKENAGIFRFMYSLIQYVIQELIICSLFNKLVEMRIFSENPGPTSIKFENPRMKLFIYLFIFSS